MDDTRIVSLSAFSSMLAPTSIVKRSWRKSATIQVDSGATKVVYLEATNLKAGNLNKFKCLSKGIWDLAKLKVFFDGLDKSKAPSNWAVSVKYFGCFITAIADFKDLSVAMSELNVELITSAFEKIVIAVRCMDSSISECLFIQRNNAGEKLKLITNEILCRDYDNFIGYILYKKLELNQEVDVVENLECFDWFVEIFLNNKGVDDITELLLNYVNELEKDNMEVCFGIYKDTDCLPGNVKHETSVKNFT